MSCPITSFMAKLDFWSPAIEYRSWKDLTKLMFEGHHFKMGSDELFLETVKKSLL